MVSCSWLPGNPGGRELGFGLHELGLNAFGDVPVRVLAHPHAKEFRGRALDRIHHERRIPFRGQLFHKSLGILTVWIRGHLHRKAWTGRIGRRGRGCCSRT